MLYNQKGFRGMQSSSSTPAFLTWDNDAASSPFMAILPPLVHIVIYRHEQYL